MGWQARGIDLSVSAVEVGKSFGVPLEVIDFFDARILPQSVDIITMSEFIEHVPMPNQILRRAEEVLRPGGVLYLTTPNFDCLDHRLTGPLWRAIGGEHLFYFTPATLKEVVRRHTTFEIVNLATKNLSPLILISWLKRLAGWKSAADATLEDGLVVGAGAELEQDLRRWGSGSLAFALAKRAANSALNAFGLGRTIEVTLRRPASADNTSR
jgi:SAM-dependent methyltransferase